MHLCVTYVQIVGVDFSGRFIDAAMNLQSGKTLSYGEGKVASLKSLEGTKPDRVTFKQVYKIIQLLKLNFYTVSCVYMYFPSYKRLFTIIRRSVWFLAVALQFFSLVKLKVIMQSTNIVGISTKCSELLT